MEFEDELMQLGQAVKDYRKGLIPAEKVVEQAESLLDCNTGLTGDQWRDPGDPKREE